MKTYPVLLFLLVLGYFIISPVYTITFNQIFIQVSHDGDAEFSISYQLEPIEYAAILARTLEKDPDYQSPGTVHKELKRKSKMVGAFPSDASLFRLGGSILVDINEDWILGNRYLSVRSEMIFLDTVTDFTALLRHYPIRFRASLTLFSPLDISDPFQE